MVLYIVYFFTFWQLLYDFNKDCKQIVLVLPFPLKASPSSPHCPGGADLPPAPVGLSSWAKPGLLLRHLPWPWGCWGGAIRACLAPAATAQPAAVPFCSATTSLFTGSRGQALGGASPALKPFPGLFVLEVVFPASLLACFGQTAAFGHVHPGMGSEQSRGHNSDPKFCSALVLGMNFCILRAGAGAGALL